MTTEMFAIDVKGLRQLEEGRDVWRAPLELIANVFDEARGYEDRPRPTRCDILIEPIPGSRAHRYVVTDDGAGFQDESDVYTLFAPTPKRSNAEVAGRFNSGEKQLIATAKSAVVKTGKTTTTFERDQRTVTNHRTAHPGTMIECVMRWTQDEAEAVREAIRRCRPPQGLRVTLNGEVLPEPTPAYCTVRVSLPTVLLNEGVMRPTVRKTNVSVLLSETEPWIYELGIPVTPVGGEFRWALDVGQKIPMPQSRDVISQAWIDKCLGFVIEAASLDGHELLTEEDDGRGFVKQAMEHITNPTAIQAVIENVHGPDAVRRSSDAGANSRAELEGQRIVSGRTLGPKTRERLNQHGILPTSHFVYGNPSPPSYTGTEVGAPALVCPNCGTAVTQPH
jgi:hypothetical protein